MNAWCDVFSRFVAVGTLVSVGVVCSGIFRLSIEEVKSNIITSDIKLVSYSSTITMMHGPICIR